MKLPAETTNHILLLWQSNFVNTEQKDSHTFATIVFNRKILYSLNQTTRCQTFMDILKKKKKQTKNDTKWNYMV